MGCCDAKNNPALFRHRIEFETPSLVPNDSGGQTKTYSSVGTYWASITPKRVREFNFAQRIEPRVEHEIRLRYIAGLSQKMRIKFGTRYFEIKAMVNDEEMNEYLTITADERTGT